MPEGWATLLDSASRGTKSSAGSGGIPPRLLSCPREPWAALLPSCSICVLS